MSDWLNTDNLDNAGVSADHLWLILFTYDCHKPLNNDLLTY